jgi:hypothetical protein
MTSGKEIGRRTVELSTGLVAWKAYDYLFDYALYPFVIWKLGPWRGGSLMASLSLFVCLFLPWIYDRLRRDWIGIEFVKGLRHYRGPSRWKQVLGWLISRGDWIAFLVLSIKFGPFITTAYLRRGAYSGMAGRDWGIFLASWLLGNMLWSFICYGGVSCVRWLF